GVSFYPYLSGFDPEGAEPLRLLPSWPMPDVPTGERAVAGLGARRESESAPESEDSSAEPVRASKRGPCAPSVPRPATAPPPASTEANPVPGEARSDAASPESAFFH